MAKKDKGFWGTVDSFFGSISVAKSVKKAGKSLKKKIQKTSKFVNNADDVVFKQSSIDKAFSKQIFN